MKITDLRYDYPESLIATEPGRPSRVLLTHKDQIRELVWDEFLDLFQNQDVLVINNTKVLKRRVFSGELEILFLTSSADRSQWQVLFPSKKFKVGDVIELPFGVSMTLTAKGRPQEVTVSESLSEEYFEKAGEIPLPPYIQKARSQRHNQEKDPDWYQTHWASQPGSFAAPTASLHFSKNDFDLLRKKGVQIVELTLHVGLGTFLPVTTEDLNDHPMHSEFVEIPKKTWEIIQAAKKNGKPVWSLGTTSTRALESQALGKFAESDDFFSGFTDLLIQPGFSWKVVDRLLTNFHQPESTLLALVAGFSSLDQVHKTYRVAIEKKMRLFSYGDLSVWIKK